MPQTQSTFEMLSSFLIKSYEDGTIFFTTDQNHFTYVLNKNLDIQDIAEGKEFPTGGFIERCILGKVEVEGLISRSVYGIRLKLNVIPVFSDSNPQEVIGTCGVYTSRLHPVAKAFDVFAPLVAEMQLEGAWLCITDLEKVAYRYGNDRFDIKEIQVGTPIVEVDLAWAAINEDRRITSEIDTNDHGRIKIVRLPLKDEESGNIVGTYGVAFPHNLAEKLGKLAKGIGASLKKAVKQTEELKDIGSKL